tara:strand:+ start:1774 stop:2130 length:357 start_codon:yes stop_codon:yes gene_type:complete
MAVIDLRKPATLPFTYRGTTSGSNNVVQEILVPTRSGITIIISNPDRASKKLVVSFDQALVDGGVGGTQYLTVDEIVEFPLDGNAASGFASITKMALYAPSHTSVNFELVIIAARPAH